MGGDHEGLHSWSRECGSQPHWGVGWQGVQGDLAGIRISELVQLS